MKISAGCVGSAGEFTPLIRIDGNDGITRMFECETRTFNTRADAKDAAQNVIDAHGNGFIIAIEAVGFQCMVTEETSAVQEKAHADEG